MVSAAKRIDLSLTYMKQCAAAIGNDDDAKWHKSFAIYYINMWCINIPYGSKEYMCGLERLRCLVLHEQMDSLNY
jgi:hypothetical protein